MGSVALISGTASGIGRACADAFLAAGFDVVGADLDAAPDGLARSDAYRHSTGDLAEPAAVEAWVRAAVDEYGRLDVLVNCAGTHPPPTPIDAATVDSFARLWAVNVLSVFTACRLALPELRKSEGCIVNVGSLVAELGQEDAVEYCTTKGAVSGLTRALAIDEARHGVRVNSVAPGAILTPLAQRLNDAEQLGVVARWGWMNRLGTPAEVADVVLFLATRAGFVTGETISVSGGAELGYGAKAPAAETP